MDSLTPDGMTIHKRSRTRALLQRARSAPGCLGLMSHAYGPRQVQETISVRQRGGGVGSSEASVLRAKSLWLYRKILMSYSLFMSTTYYLLHE